MAIDSKNLLVAVKAYSRANPLPLDASEVHDSLEAAQAYAASAKAYAGQTIKVLQDGVYVSYVLNPGTDGLTLGRIAADESSIKNYVQVVDVLPTTGQEQGVIYITPELKGQIWDGTAWQVIFEQIELIDEEGNASTVTVGEAITEINEEIAKTNEEVASVQEALDILNADANTEGSVEYKIAEALVNVDHLKREVVTELPQETIDENTIYMIANGLSGDDIYDEYMWINGEWEILGNTTVDLTGYYTKEEVDSTFATIALLANYATKADIPVVPTNVSAFVNDAGYLTQHQDLSAYAKLTDIPSLDGYAQKSDLTGYATEDFVIAHIENVSDQIPSLEGYAKLTDIPSLDGYATESWVTNAINDAQLGGGDGPNIDFSIYALKEDLGDLGGYATVTEYVNEITSALALNVVEF